MSLYNLSVVIDKRQWRVEGQERHVAWRAVHYSAVARMQDLHNGSRVECHLPVNRRGQAAQRNARTLGTTSTWSQSALLGRPPDIQAQALILVLLSASIHPLRDLSLKGLPNPASAYF